MTKYQFIQGNNYSNTAKQVILTFRRADQHQHNQQRVPGRHPGYSPSTIATTTNRRLPNACAMVYAPEQLQGLFRLRKNFSFLAGRFSYKILGLSKKIYLRNFSIIYYFTLKLKFNIIQIFLISFLYIIPCTTSFF